METGPIFVPTMLYSVFNLLGCMSYICSDVPNIIHGKYNVHGRSSQYRKKEVAANVLLHKCGGALEKNRGQATENKSV